MNEKQLIERYTADGFLELYNRRYGESYSIACHADAPDIRCRNEGGKFLNLEITLTEDRPRDIAATLGRSSHRDIGLHLVNARSTTPELALPPASSLAGNVSDRLLSRIGAKLDRDYGPRVALVIRDTSPLDWEWDFVLDDVRSQLALHDSPFDMGIWLLNLSKTRLYEIIGQVPT